MVDFLFKTIKVKIIGEPKINVDNIKKKAIVLIGKKARRRAYRESPA